MIARVRLHVYNRRGVWLALALSWSVALIAGKWQSSDPVRNFNLGVARLDRFEFEQAAEAFLEVLAADPAFIAASVNLGIARFYNQQPDLAAAALEAALSEAPSQPQAHYVLGLIRAAAGDTSAAIEHFEAVRSHDPDDPSTHYYLGRMAMEQRDYEAAVEHFRQVIEIEPYNASGHYNLATALIRTGDREAGRSSMREFQRLQGLFGSRTIGLSYLEQGRYAIALDEIPPRYSGAAVEQEWTVRFVETADAAGLGFMHSGAATADRRIANLSDLNRRVAGWVGSGLAFSDFDNDGFDDLFVADAGGESPKGRLYRNLGDGTFADVTESTGVQFSGPTTQPLWGDLDQDGLIDLYLINCGENRALRNLGGGRFQDATEAWGLSDDAWGLGGALVDADHDGDLDVFVANFIDLDAEMTGRFPTDFAGAANVLYRNNGNSTFTDVSAISGVGDSLQRSLAVVASDFDASRDIDFYVVNWAESNQLLENLRDGSFRVALGRAAEGPASAIGVAIGDVSGNGSPDIVLTGDTESQTLLNRGRARFRPEPLGPGAHGAQLLDLDNDGDRDLLLLSGLDLEGVGTGAGALRLLENRRGEWVDVSAAAGLDRFAGTAVRGVTASDYDQDGDIDLAVSVSGGRPLLLRNEGGNSGNWLVVDLEPVNSNTGGIGTTVEVWSGARRQRQELTAGSGFLASLPTSAHFGLGSARSIDAVRLLWPNGVLQTELDPSINSRFAIRELNRKGTSCPLLYVWDGHRYRFLTDFLGGSAFGYQLRPGLFNSPDTDEYVRLEPDKVGLKEGRVAVTLNNQLEEAIFFDQLQLVAVEHPAEYDVYPDEKLLPAPPFERFRLMTVGAGRPLRSAVDGMGRDQAASLSAIDRRYPEIVGPLPFKGYAEEQELILDLGETGSGDVWLLIHAWIDYADSTSNVAAAQAGLSLSPPVLEVEDAAGNWVTAVERMGFPAGLLKPMTVDLSGRFPSDSRRVRIRSNMRIYWDRILVVAEPQRSDFRVHRINAESALLSEYGFPRAVWPDGREPRIYEHDQLVESSPWKVHVGAYTRLGEVGPLLAGRDDRFVITRSGDQIEALFDITQLPATPSGWTRTYLIFADGFGKDMDPNSAAPNTVGPLPFHGMSFPYSEGEGYAADADYQRYLETWNTRLVEKAVPPPAGVAKRRRAAEGRDN